MPQPLLHACSEQPVQKYTFADLAEDQYPVKAVKILPRCIYTAIGESVAMKAPVEMVSDECADAGSWLPVQRHRHISASYLAQAFLGNNYLNDTQASVWMPTALWNTHPTKQTEIM